MVQTVRVFKSKYWKNIFNEVIFIFYIQIEIISPKVLNNIFNNKKID